MYRVIRDGKVVDIGHGGMGDTIRLPDVTDIQLWTGSMEEKPESMMVAGIDYRHDTPKQCQTCGVKLLLSPRHSMNRDIRYFQYTDGTLEIIATCMKELCHKNFMERSIRLSRDPSVIHP